MTEPYENDAYFQFFKDGPWMLDHGIIHDRSYECFKHVQLLEPVILDVGANKGQSIASFLAIFPGAFVHSFECNPAMLKILNNMRDVRPSKCERVNIYQFGLSDQNGEITFSVPVVDGVFYLEETTCEPEVELDKHRARYQMRGTDLWTYDFEAKVFRGDDLGLTPDIIKIDTEGAEPKVIRGLLKTIEKCRPFILSETSCSEEVNSILRPMGYGNYIDDIDGRIVPIYEGRANVLLVHPSRFKQIKSDFFVPEQT